MKKTSPTLAVLAGGGTLPATVAAAAQAQGYAVHVISFAGQPQPVGLTKVAGHTTLPLGAAGKVLSHLQTIKATHVVMAGGLHKPGLFSLKPDLTAIKLLTSVKVWHDDALLRAVSTLLAKRGMQVVPVTFFAPQLLAPAGLLSKARPTTAHQADITLALQTFQTIAPLDIGQALIVHRGTILGVEGPEGTDALITRCAALRGTLKKGEQGGILVKLPKPHQTNLADIPFVGPQTLTLLARHGYAGLAVQAGGTLLLAQPELKKIADQHHLFLTCITAPWQP